jgi:hypothetical protein
MPTYCYVTDDGRHHQVFMTASEMASRESKDGSIKLDDGRIAKRDFSTEWGGRRKCETWPKECDASGVLPEQIKEAQADFASAGLHCDFNAETGAAVYTSAEHRRECLRHVGLFDRDAGYSDPTPQHR